MREVAYGRPAWPHRRSQTCTVCGPIAAYLEAAAGWLLPDGAPDLGFCVTPLPAPAAFGTCRLCSVPSSHLIDLSVWRTGVFEERWGGR